MQHIRAVLARQSTPHGDQRAPMGCRSVIGSNVHVKITRRQSLPVQPEICAVYDHSGVDFGDSVRRVRAIRQRFGQVALTCAMERPGSRPAIESASSRDLGRVSLGR